MPYKEVMNSTKKKIEKWDIAMILTEMNKEHELFDVDFEIFLISIIHKMPLLIFQIILAVY